MAGIHDISNSSHHELLPDIEQNLTQLRIAHSKQPKLLLQILRQLRQVEPAKRQERDTDQGIDAQPHLLPQRKLAKRSNCHSNWKINKSHSRPNGLGSLSCTEHLRSEEHTSELQSRFDLVCRLLLEKKNTQEPHAHKSLTHLQSLH